MKLLELYEPTPAGYRSEREDNTVLHADDTRKTRLTFDRLNRLRMMNDVRKLENEKKLVTVSDQYKPAQAPEGLV